MDETEFLDTLKNNGIEAKALGGATIRISDDKGTADFWTNGDKLEFVLDKGLNASTSKIVKSIYKDIAVYKAESMNGAYLVKPNGDNVQ